MRESTKSRELIEGGKGLIQNILQEVGKKVKEYKQIEQDLRTSQTLAKASEKIRSL